MYIVLYIQRTQLFKECTQLCTFNVYNLSNNESNSMYSTYTFFKEFTQFCKFNVYNFSKNVHKFFKQCVQFYTFNVNNFSFFLLIQDRILF